MSTSPQTRAPAGVGHEPGPDPASETVAALRESLLRGEYVPGQRLVEADLCERYDVSRAVVRVALQQLTSDGLIEVTRHKGARVREVSLAEAIEVTEVRMVLEGLVARKAAERITADAKRNLRDIGARMRAAVSAGDMLAYSDLNVTLHSTVRAIAAHETAAGIIERLRGQMVRHQFQLSLQPGRPAVSLPQHQRIIKAVIAGKPDDAEDAMRAHLTSVAQALRDSQQNR